MAKRKRKMTLFDVINTGPAKGLQVRHRVPTYQPVPELPVQKKLNKLFGRGATGGKSDRPLTAAEELERLRRELSPPPEPVEAREPAPVEPVARITTRVVEYEPAPAEIRREPAPTLSVSDRVRMLAAEAEADEPAGAPRRPIGARLADGWASVSPHLANAGRSLGRLTSGGLIGLRTQAGRLRELQSSYGVTAITFASVMLLFIGSFYVGKFLFHRPATATTFADNAVAGSANPSVLDLKNAPRATDPVANVDSRRGEPTLVNRPQDPTQANAPISAAFGGRNPSLNYVIIQSCASQIDADATVEILAKYNVPTTVETGLNFNRTLPFAVVSKQGFAKITNNPELTNFMSTLGRISEKEAGNTIRDRLDPQPYKYHPLTH